MPPHDKKALRKTRGLEAAVVDNTEMEIASLEPNDTRTTVARVAGPAALIVAKICKLTDRLETPRLNDKDAHDVYRLLVAISTSEFVAGMERLLSHDVSGEVTKDAVAAMREHMGVGSGDLYCVMAGRAELNIGDPDLVQAAMAALASDLWKGLDLT